MDKTTLEALARRAGLDKALAQFPEDVAAAAAQAETVASRNQGAGRSARRAVAADACGRRRMTDLHWMTASAAAQAIAARSSRPSSS